MNRTRASKVDTTKWYNNASTALNRVLPAFFHDYVTNRYWDSANGEGAFPFTSMRLGAGTQYHANGGLGWGPHQFCTRGNTFTSWGSFADGTVTGNYGTSPTGAPSSLITWTATNPTTGLILSNLTAVVGGQMAFSVYLRRFNHDWCRIAMYSTSNTSNQVRAWVNLATKQLGTVSQSGGQLVGATIQDAGNGWVRVTIIGNAGWTGATDGNLLVATTTGDNSTTRVGDGAAIEVSSAILENYGSQTPQTWRSEFATSGSAWFGPRFDYDPQTLALRGLLVEPLTTNLTPRSETYNPADWNNLSNCVATYVGEQWGRPINRVTVTATGAAQFNFISTASVTPVASTVYTISAFFRRGNTARVQYTPSANFTDAYMNYNFDTGLITLGGANVVAGSGYAQILQGGWVRLQFSFTSIGVPAGGAPCIVAFIDSDAALRLAGTTTNGSFFDCFGFQMEILGIASSYIPTLGTTASRVVDTTSITPVNWLTQNKGTLYVEVFTNKSDANSRRVVTIDDNTTNNRLQMTRGSTSYTAVSTIAGVSDFAPSSTGSNSFAVDKVAARYNSAGKAICSNGGTVGSNAVSPPTSGYTHMSIGHITAFTPGNASHAWIRQVRYYADDSSSNAQLQALTTL